MKRLLALLVCLILVAAAFAGCGNNNETPAASGAGQDGYTTALEDIVNAGVLVVGLDDSFAPMGFRDADGKLVGFDIDLANAVCAELGVTAEFQPIDWDAKEMELNTGNIDCIWNGMSATPARQESMSLSQNYLNNKIVVMTNPDVAIAGKDALVDFNIGVQGGSAALEALHSDAVWDTIADKVVEYPTYDEVILDMNTGRLDCMVIDEVFGNYKNAQQEARFGVAEFDFGDDLYAVGFRKADTQLRDAVNVALDKLIADGAAAEISGKWFGKDIVIGG